MAILGPEFEIPATDLNLGPNVNTCDFRRDLNVAFSQIRRHSAIFGQKSGHNSKKMGPPTKWKKTRTAAAGPKHPAGPDTGSALAIQAVPRWARRHVRQFGKWGALLLTMLHRGDIDPEAARGCCSMTLVGDESNHAVLWPEHVPTLVAMCRTMMDSGRTRPCVLCMVHIAIPVHTLVALVTLIPAEVEVQISGTLGCIAIIGTPEAGVGIDSDRIVPINMALMAQLRALDLGPDQPVPGASE